MSVSRASLGRGPAVATYNSATFYMRDDLAVRHIATKKDVRTTRSGKIDQYKSDLVIKIPLLLYGAWTSLSTLFPSYILNPDAGASIFGSSDTPLVILATNGDKITYANAQITKLMDLYLGVEEELFVAALELTALIANSANPEDAGAYYTIATGQTFTDSFTNTNFVKARCSGAWGAKTGFTAIIPQTGVRIAWQFTPKPIFCDGLGTVDMAVEDLIGGCRCIPIQPTLAQIETQAHLQGSGNAHGLLQSANAADLTWTFGGKSVVLKNAGMTESGLVFGIDKLRVGEMAWETTRGFSSGAATAVATVS